MSNAALAPYRITTGISITVAVVALGVAGFALHRSSKPANEIVLRDPAGKPRVRLTATETGGVIELLDEGGRARLALRELADRFVVEMMPPEGEDYSVRLGARHDGVGTLSMKAPQGGFVDLGTYANGGGGMSVIGKTYAAKLGASPTAGDFLLTNKNMSLSTMMMSEQLGVTIRLEGRVQVNGDDVTFSNPQ